MAGKKIESKKPRASDSQIGIVKYFELYGGEVHKYTQAFLGNRYRDIMKTKAEWKLLVKNEMEGNK